jgi:hypothetical protein
MTRTLVLFVFHVVNDRVTSFIRNAIFYDDNIDFVVISNDKNNVFEVPSYVKTFHRENIGYDFGGWSEVLLKNNLYENYDTFIFCNSSIIGPFITAKWTDIYLNELKHVKLTGSTINTISEPMTKAHVQSYIFAMDKNTLEYLIKCEIFSNTNIAKTFEEAIWNKEVLMSRKVIENGWNIGSLLLQYNGVDFTFRNKQPQDYTNVKFYGDIMYPHYEGKLWDRNQLVFIKGNRG